MSKKKVTLITTFIMDDSEESIENFKDFKEGAESGELNDHINGEGWSDATATLTVEDIVE